jgi:tetratricopeptide (TPR) repeat protein
LEAGDADEAWRDFELALEVDERFVDALACRAGLAFDRGDTDAAIRDLTRAIEITAEDPDLYCNRAQALQSAGCWDAAMRDYTRALDLPGADRDAILVKQGLCHREAGNVVPRPDDMALTEKVRGPSRSAMP